MKAKAFTFLVLDLGLDIVDGVAGLDLESDGLPGQGFHEDLHFSLSLALSRSVWGLGFGFGCEVYICGYQGFGGVMGGVWLRRLLRSGWILKSADRLGFLGFACF